MKPADTKERWFLIALATACTLLNAFKPVHIDDAAYYYYARQAADSPLDPYGFAVFWYDHPEPANEVLAPPVLPYWWSLALRVSDEPAVWKLWLFPFVLCLVWSLYALARRFAGRLALLLTCLTALSPAFLPSLNLMLDIPALALSLAAVALFVAAADRASLPLALAAGLVAGLAMETKYTGFLAPAAIVLYALTHRRLRLALPAGAVALGVFIAWEGFIAWKYGESHFLYHLRESEGSPLQKVYLIPLLFSIPGTVGPPVLLLGLLALGLRARWVLAAGAMCLLGYVAVACLDLRFTGSLTPSAALFGRQPVFRWEFTLAEAVFGTFGVVLWGTAAGAIWRLGRGRRGRVRRDVWFLGLWLALEAAGFFALSPFPAVRRVLGILVVLTLLTGRLAALSCRAHPCRGLVWGIVGFSASLGLLFHVVDWRAAEAQKEAVERALRWVRQGGSAENGTANRVWFTGHWGFQFYAEKAGLRPVTADYSREGAGMSLPPPSRLRRGDWVIVPDRRIAQQGLRVDEERLTLVHELAIDDWLPLTTIRYFYVGHVGLEHRRGPRLRVRIYRVEEDCVPEEGPDGFPGAARKVVRGRRSGGGGEKRNPRHEDR